MPSAPDIAHTPAPGITPSKRRNRVRAVLIVIAGAILVALILAEGILRIAWTPTITANVETRGPHPDYGFAPLPDASGRFVRTEYNIAFRHTAQRMRGDTIRKAERAPETRGRVLFLGDSFTYGITCEEDETIPARVGQRWPGIEVINSACTGYGPREELAVLDKLGAVLKPEITVLITFWNDFEDALRTEPLYEKDAAGHVHRVNPPDAASDPLRLWPAEQVHPRSKWRTCYIYEVLREATARLRHKTIGRERPNQTNTAEEMERGWQAMESQLDLIKKRADEIGSRFVVLSIPDYALVNPQSTIAGVHSLNYVVQERLAKICATHGITFLDGLPAMQTAFSANGGETGASKNPLYFDVDRHCTPLGCRVLADFLATEIEPLLPPK